MEAVLKAHTFYLKQLSDGAFKLDMSFGLYGGWNESSRDSSGSGREGGYGQRGTFGGSMTGGKGFSSWNDNSRGEKSRSCKSSTSIKPLQSKPVKATASAKGSSSVKETAASVVPAKG